MANGVNKAIVLGNLGGDPEARVFQNGGRKVSFSIATSNYWTDKTSRERKERTQWHNIVCFNKLAEIAEGMLHKGSKVYVEGEMQTSKWTDGNGIEKQRLEIIARTIEILESRQRPQEPHQATLPTNQGDEVDDDDIPF